MIEIEKILQAREERDSIKKKLSESGNILISLSLNIPGYPKSNQLISDFFHLVRRQLTDWLLANRIFIDNSKEIVINQAAGDYFIAPLKTKSENAKLIKQITEEFEISHPLGRFIDVDVTDEKGEAIGSGKSKLCFFCKKYPAIECRRSERHAITELQEYQQKKIKSYLHKTRLAKISRKINSIALRSIFYEISLTPKPGLVDKQGSGTHSDMNFQTFIDSTSVISTFFQTLIEKGFQCKSKNLQRSLPLIRQIGLQMEKEMFENTNGVNTQKGLIFLMGVSLFTCGYVLKKSNSFNPEIFRETIRIICRDMVQSELLADKNESKSHGEKCFNQFKVAGIRHEAENGFPTVFNYALPILKSQNSTGSHALILTLLSIMSELDDTNVLFRSNSETLNNLKEKCKLVFENYSFDKYKEITDFCMKEKISPGGAADLLCITVFVYLMIKNFQ